MTSCCCCHADRCGMARSLADERPCRQQFDVGANCATTIPDDSTTPTSDGPLLGELARHSASPSHGDDDLELHPSSLHLTSWSPPPYIPSFSAAVHCPLANRIAVVQVPLSGDDAVDILASPIPRSRARFIPVIQMLPQLPILGSPAPSSSPPSYASFTNPTRTSSQTLPSSLPSYSMAVTLYQDTVSHPSSTCFPPPFTPSNHDERYHTDTDRFSSNPRVIESNV